MRCLMVMRDHKLTNNAWQMIVMIVCLIMFDLFVYDDLNNLRYLWVCRDSDMPRFNVTCYAIMYVSYMIFGVVLYI